ncbi:MAG: MBL fold metallo-hydrolase, partial [Planctomycetes bacterium]|nr:MBL fold metallo-hydrolase [Planctomycetota bacterium]
DDWYEDIPLIAEHGLSDYVTIYKGRRRYSLLYDLGLTSRALSNNAEALQLDFSALDAILMSHGHIDHTGGLGGLKEKIGRMIPVILHPDAFSKRKIIFPDGTSANLPPPDRTELKDAGVEVVEGKEPSFLIDNLALFTGEHEKTGRTIVGHACSGRRELSNRLGRPPRFSGPRNPIEFRLAHQGRACERRAQTFESSERWRYDRAPQHRRLAPRPTI